MPTPLTRRDFLATSAAAAACLAGRPAFAQATDPADLTIAEAQRLVRRRDLSPVDLVEAYTARIRRLDARLNAYVTVTEERAVERARALEAELAGGRWRGPLHGIPIGLKDNIDTAGVRTTAGSAVYADRVPDEDAEVVTRLEAAGAIVLGKLNLHEFAYGGTSAFTLSGPVRNPWDVDRIPGGSSGGSGAAVAARLCAGALGTDTGGSVRIPAAHCGIVGLKATYGLASIRGIVPLSVSLDHVGPMCRSVADAALMLQAMAGYDPRGIASIQAEIPRLRERAPAPHVGAAPRRAAGVLRGRGLAGPGRRRAGARRPGRSHGKHAGRGATGAAGDPHGRGSRRTPITPISWKRAATCTTRARWRASRAGRRCRRPTTPRRAISSRS